MPRFKVSDYMKDRKLVRQKVINDKRKIDEVCKQLDDMSEQLAAKEKLLKAKSDRLRFLEKKVEKMVEEVEEMEDIRGSFESSPERQNVTKDNGNDMHGTFGKEEKNKWRPWEYSHRVKVVKRVEDLKKKQSKEKLKETTKRSKPFNVRLKNRPTSPSVIPVIKEKNDMSDPIVVKVITSPFLFLAE
ncbi:hypothetical protein QZH41_000518 [Actinostola sp. cb2023]|nr:hypothetical protein QZH41_000518 [Actinostola sp. cb2023]